MANQVIIPNLSCTGPSPSESELILPIETSSVLSEIATTASKIEYPEKICPAEPDAILSPETQPPGTTPFSPWCGPYLIPPFAATGPGPVYVECVCNGGGGGGFTEPFNIMIIRYRWGPSNGKDLDTRTAFLELGSAVNNIDVGWARNTVINGVNGHILMQWNGDNRSEYGPEAVAINFDQTSINYPTVDTLKVRIRAFWYNIRTNGDFNIDFETYFGGAIVPNGFDFTCTGLLKQQIIVPANAISNQATNLDGDDIGYVQYNKTTMTASFFQA